MSILGFIVLAATAAPSPAAPAADKADLAVVHRIRHEVARGEVASHLFHLTDVNGPRLTASPGFDRAAAWVVERLKQWGITNAGLEPWGKFGRAWTLKHYSAHLREPVHTPLGGVLNAWSGGTTGPVAGEVVAAPLYAKDEPSEFEPDRLAARIARWRDKHKGTLRGRIVLLDPPRELGLPGPAAAPRHDDRRLAEIAEAPEPVAPIPWIWPLRDLPYGEAKRRDLLAQVPPEVRYELTQRMRHARRALHAALREEGVAAVLKTDVRGGGNIVFAMADGPWDADVPVPPPMIVLTPEEYARLWRLVDKKVPTKVEVHAEVEAGDKATDAVNVIAEIPGGSKKDEIVMLGAHLDSWHGGTGATDNAAGCAVMLEAMRVLKRLDLPLARTVRLALWSGEEQGLLGSRAYVRQHFADPVTMALRPEHERLSAYFNLDNGAGRIRGVYLQDNDMVRPIFDAWLAPFRDMGSKTLTLRQNMSTDNVSFDAVGLPGFQFVQDPLEYGSRTHHSDVDVYDYALVGDLMHSTSVVASFVYHAANRAEKLPRKPLPAPLPPQVPLPSR